MKIDNGVIRPLGSYDCTALIDKLKSLSNEDWEKNTFRQEKYKNVHSKTKSIILIFCDGWPEIKISRLEEWGDYQDLVKPLIKDILSSHYPPGGRILRAMLAKLPAKCFIDPHVDSHPSFAISHRIHVPLITNPNVKFIIGNELVNIQEQHAFEINNMLEHSVINYGDSDRIHLIFDYAPKDMINQIENI